MIAAAREASEVNLEHLAFLVLTVVAFGVALFLTYTSRWVPALVAAFIGLLLVVYVL